MSNKHHPGNWRRDDMRDLEPCNPDLSPDQSDKGSPGRLLRYRDGKRIALQHQIILRVGTAVTRVIEYFDFRDTPCTRFGQRA